MEYDESKMHKSMIYYNISEEAKEFRKKGGDPYVIRQGIVSIFDRLGVTEEEKIRFRYLLEREFEKRLVGYICENVSDIQCGHFEFPIYMF